ncbi:MAG TPA: protein kinase [Clostridia bacterium]|nr:protein kinase [Clostridia bacterium]
MIGKIVSDRYMVESLIGSGGMADVYRAFDRVEQRVIALKVLKQEHRGDLEFIRRFEREAKAVLTLNHENIVRSYDVGEDDGLSYIVLEYVEGSTLKEIIKSDGPLSPKVAVNITCQVLDALSHAHECGIIHRDVKPQNVIITPKGRAKLTDFGIARDAASTTRTFAGQNVVGSVHYISPEQARGENVTAASDIYSCAIMLYEMLTGEVPFGGDNSVAIALRHLQEDIIPPRELNARIPRALDDIVVRAASKNPRQRYATARQMKADLFRALREPNGKFARPQSGEGGAAKRKTHSGVINIAIMLTIVLGLFTAMFFIARAIRDEGEAAGSEYIIPTLTGKALDKAKELAELRGFTVVVDEDKPFSNDYEAGVVMEQEPLAGTHGKAGDEILVTVSGGSDSVEVPKLVGVTIQDALALITDLDLTLGTPNYVNSEQPEGQIVKQFPEAGTDTFRGDAVDIWVSGSPGTNGEVPGVCDVQLDVAVSMLAEDGFKTILIHPITPDTLSTEEQVLRQNPSSGISVSTDTKVELWVCRTFLGLYSADIAYNLDIAADKSEVVVTAVTGDGIETAIYETILAAGGQQAISFTGTLPAGGEYECHVYVNGVEVKEKSRIVSFKQK